MQAREEREKCGGRRDGGSSTAEKYKFGGAVVWWRARRPESLGLHKAQHRRLFLVAFLAVKIRRIKDKGL
jgi:hypothetical protein